MITIVEPDPTTAARLVGILAAGALPRSTVVTTTGEVASHSAVPGIVVVGPGISFADAASMALLRRSHPGNSTLLVRQAVDQLLLTEAIRAGVSDVAVDGDDLALVAAVERSVQHLTSFTEAFTETGASGGDKPPALQLTVFSTKGGVGKSVVAVNVAAALATRGHRTCVVDLDVHAGDVALMLGLTPQHTLADLDLIHGALDEPAVRSLVTRHSDDLDVLAAPVRIDSQLRPEAVASVLEVLSGMYDAVVVDTSGNFDDPAVQALDRCDLAVLVGTVDVLSLKSLKLTVGTLDLLGLPRDRWRLVLNRADDRIGLGAKDFEDTLALPPTASIPSSRDVRASVNRGEAVVRSAPRDGAAKALDRLAHLLWQDAVPAAATSSGTSGAGKRRERRRSRKVAAR